MFCSIGENSLSSEYDIEPVFAGLTCVHCFDANLLRILNVVTTFHLVRQISHKDFLFHSQLKKLLSFGKILNRKYGKLNYSTLQTTSFKFTL